MATVAGIVAFFLAVLLSYQLFPDPGTGESYAGGRFFFTILVTVVVSVIASKISKSRRAEQEHREAELKRERELAEREAEREAERTRIREELEREDARRSAVLADSRSRVDHLRALLQRREQHRRDARYREGRHTYGVVSDELLAEIVWEKLHTPHDERNIITAEQMELLTGDLYISTYRNQRRELDLEGMQYATNIDTLSLNPIDDEVDLTPIAGLVSLRRLEIRGGEGISNIDALATLDGLQHLELAHLPNIRDFRPLAGLERLARLELTSLSDSLEFDSISGLTGLTKLEISHMSWLNDLSGISNVRQLQDLEIYSTGDLRDLSMLAKLSRLERLRLGRTHIRGLREVGNLTTLKSLTLHEVSGVGELEALSNLIQLTQLDLTFVRLDLDKYVRGSLDLGPLGSLSRLRKLTLVGDSFNGFEDWDAISKIRSLVHLKVAGNLNRSNALDAVSRLESLETLHISAGFLPELEPLSSLSRLERLEIEGEWFEYGPTSLRNLELLAVLPRLQTLVIDTCKGWNLLRDIGHFHRLTHLELKNCEVAPEYEDLGALANLTRLETLVLRENSNIERDLSPIEHLPRLKNLTVTSKIYESPWDTSRFENIVQSRPFN